MGNTFSCPGCGSCTEAVWDVVQADANPDRCPTCKMPGETLRVVAFVQQRYAAKLEAAPAEAETEEPFFEPGKTYLSANRAFEFTCERVIDGVAIGYEREFDPRWNPSKRRAWHGVMAEGCYTEVAPQEDSDG